MWILDNEMDMNHEHLRQFFYAQLTGHYIQSELQALYHWCAAEIEGWSRAEAYLNNTVEVAEQSLVRWEAVIKRLIQQEPVQYIFSKAYFRDLCLSVNSDVLIPRPETEELVDVLFSAVSAYSTRVFDIGTGSGCIALSIKSERPKWQVSGCDISAAALAVAVKNAEKLKLDVNFSQADVFDERFSLPPCDVVISNPPYIPLELSNTLSANVLQYEPHTALFSPHNRPFAFFERITALAEKSGCASVFFETHATEIQTLVQLLQQIWNGTVTIHHDLAGKPRFVVLQR